MYPRISNHDYFKDISNYVKSSRDIELLMGLKRTSKLSYEANKSFPSNKRYWEDLNIHCNCILRIDKVLKSALNALAVCAVVNCLTNKRYSMSKLFYYLLEESHFYHFTQFSTIVHGPDAPA